MADQSRCTLDLLSPVSLAIVRTLQARRAAPVRARLKAHPQPWPKAAVCVPVQGRL